MGTTGDVSDVQTEESGAPAAYSPAMILLAELDGAGVGLGPLIGVAGLAVLACLIAWVLVIAWRERRQ